MKDKYAKLGELYQKKNRTKDEQWSHIYKTYDKDLYCIWYAVFQYLYVYPSF